MSFLKKVFGDKTGQADNSSVCKSEQELIEKYGGIALEKQRHFSSILSDSHHWDVDMDTGEIRFGDKLIFPFQILGTFSHASESWLWAWANERSEIPATLMKQALALQKYGQDNEIDFLKNSCSDAAMNDLHLVGLIATGMFNASGYYLANYGQGHMCVTVQSDEIDNGYESNHHSILTVFPQLISLFEMNHQKALIHYLQTKGYETKEEGNILTGSKDGKIIKAEFDNLFRLTKLNG
jgi:hypothetical protein